jgi:hypothetical protein
MVKSFNDYGHGHFVEKPTDLACLESLNTANVISSSAYEKRHGYRRRDVRN